MLYNENKLLVINNKIFVEVLYFSAYLSVRCSINNDIIIRTLVRTLDCLDVGTVLL